MFCLYEWEYLYLQLEIEAGEIIMPKGHVVSEDV